jgi:Family of unknown function (DUF5681)
VSSRKGRSPDYVVGYRRPPKATRFQPGTSGNSGGRPKGSRTVSAVLKEILEQKIVVTENGVSRRVRKLEVMIHRLVNDAVRGEPRALKLLLSLNDRYEASPVTKLQLGELLAEDQAILTQYFPEPEETASDLAQHAALKGDGGDL